jgi:HD-GYP domain-containing protein (c-di-GMP phosphodiesterase class II)
MSHVMHLADCERSLAFVAGLSGAAQLGVTILRAMTSPSAQRLAALADEMRLQNRSDAIAAMRGLIAERCGLSYSPMVMDNALQAWACNQQARRAETVSLELMADLIDLQQPWLCGHSRRVAVASRDAASRIGLDAATQQRCYRAALVHSIGRGAVPSELWSAGRPLLPAVRERLRIAPYWTLRALREVTDMALEADIASYAGERLDGSGNFRSAIGADIPIEGQVLAAASAWVALQSVRPWRPALSVAMASEELANEANAGRFHPGVVDALRYLPTMPEALPSVRISLSEREADVLQAVSRGHTNKQAARLLGISPRTVSTHMESAFRKLNCTTRAAAALKAVTLRLI